MISLGKKPEDPSVYLDLLWHAKSGSVRSVFARRMPKKTYNVCKKTKKIASKSRKYISANPPATSWQKGTADGARLGKPKCQPVQQNNFILYGLLNEAVISSGVQ
jgi:hypothetical protein